MVIENLAEASIVKFVQHHEGTGTGTHRLQSGLVEATPIISKLLSVEM